MDRTNLVEIKKGETGTGILIENDGFISSKVGDNQKLFEDINSGRENGDFYCPKPFIVSAVFQKFGLENANGRIYPESVLKREVEKYQKLIQDRAAIGECYRPEAMVLTESGWKHLFEVKVGENILTLNAETNEIEIQPVKNITSYHYDGDMINIKGNDIDDVVTPDHGFPIYDGDFHFKFFMTAKELFVCDMDFDCFLPFNDLIDSSSLDGKIKLINLNDCKFSKVKYNGDVMCVEVDNHIWYVMDNNRCHWTKNCNHPSESVIDLSRTAINIIELHWEGHTLVGKMEVLISEGFRKYGIISCQGDQVAHLLLSGIKIGVSSRGLGTVSNKMGTLYVADDYEIICWDVVSSPSTNGAYISTNGVEGLQPYIESKENDETRLIDEKINKFSDWLI